MSEQVSPTVGWQGSLLHVLMASIAVGVAQILSERYGQPILGWFIGGTIMAVSAQFIFASKTRSVPIKLGIALILGVFATALINLLHTIWG